MSVAAIKQQIQNRIALVCGSPDSEHLAPFNDSSWGIWTLGNRLDRHAGRRVTRIFEIHDNLEEHGDSLAYAKWLVSQNIPMVVGEGFPITADHVMVFPFESAKELYGSEYLTSSTAYMMALALLEGATEIGVYGSSMSVDDNEYRYQRPCMEAWIGFAKGRGVKVTIPDISPLGKLDYVEGRNSGGKPEFSKPPFTSCAFLEMADLHEQKMQEKSAQIRVLEDAIQVHGGAKQAYERLAKVARAVESGQTVTLKDTVVMK